MTDLLSVLNTGQWLVPYLTGLLMTLFHINYLLPGTEIYFYFYGHLVTSGLVCFSDSSRLLLAFLGFYMGLLTYYTS